MDDIPQPGYRFIPTRVGSMALCAKNICAGAVHPHSRGEHSTFYPIDAAADGSSPLAWGAWRRALFGGCCLWFIPTRVGSIMVDLG